MARDEQIFGLVVVIVSHRQRHRALERVRHALGQRRHALEPAPRRHLREANRRRDGSRVVGGNGHVGVERQDRVAYKRTRRAPRAAHAARGSQSLETDLVGRGDLHGAVEALRLTCRLGRAARARQPEGTLEEAGGLPRQLRQLPLQRLELPGGFASRSAREQEVHQVEPGDDIRRSACHHTA